jgi:catechol 2,3-dioxygenase-like lactoylglutathione lyase family enzyme
MTMREECIVRSIGHTGITVSNLERSIAFYRHALGLTVSDPLHLSDAAVSRITGIERAELDVAYVRAPGHVLELMCFARPRSDRPSELIPCDPGFFHICLKVNNVENVVDAARSAGFEAQNPIEVFSDGPARGMKVVYLRDPDGVVIELAEEPCGLIFEELFFPETD